MTTFVKLTSPTKDHPMYVNPEYVLYVSNRWGPTRLHFHEEEFNVKESLEETLALLRGEKVAS